MNGIILKNHELSKKTAEYEQLVQLTLEYERDYHVALHKEILKMKDAGETATFINSTVKLSPAVADLRLAYHICEAKERACLQAIKDCRCAIDSYRSLLAWEKAAKTEL